MLHGKFQQFTIRGFDAMIILVMTYFIDGFQPESPFKTILTIFSLKYKNFPLIRVYQKKALYILRLGVFLSHFMFDNDGGVVF